MTVPFDVTPDFMRVTADKCDATNGSIYSGLMALKQYVLSLEGLWIGKSAMAFQELMVAWQVNSDRLNSILPQVAIGLRRNAAEYEGADLGEQGSYVGINAGLPTVNL